MFTRIFLKGLVTVLPPALTLYLLYWLGVSSENLILDIWRLLKLPQTFYVPGMGVALGVVAIFVVGLLMQSWLLNKVVGFANAIMLRIPIIKSVFSAIEDVVAYVAKDKADDSQQKVVSMELLDGCKLLGFVTRDDHARLKNFGAEEGDVLVYFPLSYQIGGYSLLVPQEKLAPLEIGVEDAMRFMLTAGVVGEKKS